MLPVYADTQHNGEATYAVGLVIRHVLVATVEEEGVVLCHFQAQAEAVAYHILAAKAGTQPQTVLRRPLAKQHAKAETHVAVKPEVLAEARVDGVAGADVNVGIAYVHVVSLLERVPHVEVQAKSHPRLPETLQAQVALYAHQVFVGASPEIARDIHLGGRQIKTSTNLHCPVYFLSLQGQRC